jgi:hypothetical protein
VALTLAISLMLTVPSVLADQHKEPADDFPSEVASVWFDTLYDVVKSGATEPPRAALICGVAAVVLYKAVVPGALHHRLLVGQWCRDDVGANGTQVERGEATESIALGERRSTCFERSN